MNATATHPQFQWAMNRLAQMQAGSLDQLRLSAASTALDQYTDPVQALAQVCQRKWPLQ
jgi:hypothetical protein